MILSAKKNGGFSLIELAIITTIIGLLMSASLQTYRTYSITKAFHTTDTKRELVEQGMSRHLFNFNFIPCPAGPMLAPSAANAGKSNCSTATAAGTCDATTGICVVDGFRHSPCNPFAVTVKDRVIIGTLPYIDLGISIKDSIDGWGNRLAYATSIYLTSAATYNEDCGAINVQTYSRATDAITNSFYAAPSGNTIGGYLFVMFSHGPDGKGAYNYYGERKACTAGARDSENCDMNSTFVMNGDQYADNLISTKAGATFYDDPFMMTDVKRDVDKWSRVGLTAIRNKSTGRVGIGGIPDAVQDYKLDVVGNIKLQDYQVDTICNNAGVCFNQDMIGGAGVSCNGGLVTGIANSNVSCVSQISTAGLTPGNCPAGQLLKGFTALGGIICLAP